ncbi:NUDIX domain-containing protein [Streptomyces sp. NPDC056975]|uniref:NUDIX domain-containing protein n=1 Tax=Streptomyces sp. NPDC056975 TaxID=3345985 RepID=UPI00362F8B75
MSSELAQPVIDTHVIVRDGDKILFSQRGGPYGHGRWHMPSGKLDGGEALTVGAARELEEETGLVVAPQDLRLVQVVHHHQDEEIDRIGFFFEATQWTGSPVNREPAKCMALEWFTAHELPDDIIEYPEAGLLGYLGREGQVAYLNSPGLLVEHDWK